MYACGCLNPIDIASSLVGWGLAGVALFVLGLVCLVGLLTAAALAAARLVARLARRPRLGGHDDAGRDGASAHGTGGPSRTGLAAFTWEEERSGS
ncbi:hypothetical protein V1J52_01615 [Streptomyces sp. TRM 70351]|uniref:hypothetical protein n=1 Tax=Streptomyces sp. TRM 70351 TaxID=3116552 RepID=UPI002E7AD967|nr:hypothetical protein [Streptomyces sp. TRM 70351]MEE1926892.1 hypothetical protein [Streptomyces sp. TRM 70351]